MQGGGVAGPAYGISMQAGAEPREQALVGALPLGPTGSCWKGPPLHHLSMGGIAGFLAGPAFLVKDPSEEEQASLGPQSRATAGSGLS